MIRRASVSVKKLVLIETLVTSTAFEAFDERALIRLTGFDVREADAVLDRPARERAADELRPVVAHDALGTAALLHESRQHGGNGVA